MALNTCFSLQILSPDENLLISVGLIFPIHSTITVDGGRDGVQGNSEDLYNSGEARLMSSANCGDRGGLLYAQLFTVFLGPETYCMF